jgi:hypothetical protein
VITSLRWNKTRTTLQSYLGHGHLLLTVNANIKLKLKRWAAGTPPRKYFKKGYTKNVNKYQTLFNNVRTRVLYSLLIQIILDEIHVLFCSGFQSQWLVFKIYNFININKYVPLYHWDMQRMWTNIKLCLTTYVHVYYIVFSFNSYCTYAMRIY